MHSIEKRMLKFLCFIQGVRFPLSTLAHQLFPRLVGQIGFSPRLPLACSPPLLLYIIIQTNANTSSLLFLHVIQYALAYKFSIAPYHYVLLR